MALQNEWYGIWVESYGIFLVALYESTFYYLSD